MYIDPIIGYKHAGLSADSSSTLTAPYKKIIYASHRLYRVNNYEGCCRTPALGFGEATEEDLT
jgi:hypothetical protein